MRVDGIGPRTWLLGALAAWAVVFLLAALLGMGGRVGVAGPGGNEARLPATTLPNVARPGPLPQYSESWTRPLLSENRRPQPFFISGADAGAQANTFDYTLTGVLITPRVSLAILTSPQPDVQPLRVKLGEGVESAPGWSLAKLEPRSATFVGPEGEKVLPLLTFDGSGGIAPTAVAAPQAGVIQESVPGQETPGPQGAPELAPGQPVAPPSAAGPAPAAPAQPAQPASTTGDAQLEAIRRRIEARRAQMRQQQSQNTPATPGQTP